MSYDRTVAAALAETKSKFALAEALALDIPPRRGRTAEDETSTREFVEAARHQIEQAGGEPRSTNYLMQCRAVALWVMEPSTFRFRWIEGASFTAHNDARSAGMSYDDFVAAPSKKLRDLSPSKREMATRDVKDWPAERKAEVARELLNDPEVAEEIEDDVTDYVASDPKRTASAVRKSRDAEPIPQAEPEKRPKRDYSAMVEQHVNGLSVALAAESSGVWEPTEHDEALLYFLAQILGNRNEPKGEQADFVNEKLENLFAEAEAYANSEVR